MLRKSITIASTLPIDLIDLTGLLRQMIGDEKWMDGLLVVSTPHSTAGVVVNEKCEELKKDFLDFSAKIAPAQGAYNHNLIAIDGRPNAHSHLLKYFINSSETLIVQNGQPELGTWQSVFFVELDGPRQSRVIHFTFLPSPP